MTDENRCQLAEADRCDDLASDSGEDSPYGVDEESLRTTAPHAAVSRPPRVALGTQPLAPDEREAVAKHVVVAIGIDQYAAWPHLSNAVNDARGTSEVFRNLGFLETHSLVNGGATGEAIRKLVTDDLAKLGVNDSLVIFFAGHGGTTTRVLQDGTKIKTGYIIPADAHNTEGEVSTWIRLDSWLNEIARLPPKHILVILDACHSGIALDALVKWRDVNTWQSEPMDELSRRRSRRVIVSALDSQIALDGGPVVGHSLFTGCLIDALTGGLRRDGQQTVTGTELGLHLQRRVKTYPNSRQTPDFGAFEWDDRGELHIPLAPLQIESTTPSIPIAIGDVNAALRKRLAVELARLVPDRAAIATLVAARAPMIGDLPTGPAVMIWMYVLAALTDCGAFSEILALVETVRHRSRRSRRVDWSAFAALFQPPPAPVVASWSHLALELRRDGADASTTGSPLITRGDTLLEAVSTLRWGGMRPADPSIEVTSYQLFGRTMPLLHEATLLPSTSPGVASWLVKLPVPHARIRTRRVTVRCIGTNLVERRYVVPRTGWMCAALVWLAFAAFAWSWLSSISASLVTVPVTVLGILYALWSLVGVHVLRVSHDKRSFGSLFFAWELAVLFAAVATVLVVVVPRPMVLVTNAVGRPVQFVGRKPIPVGVKKQLSPTGMARWELKRPFCRCPEKDCQPCNESGPINGVDQQVFGCIRNDCDHIIQEVHLGGDATIIQPVDVSLSDLYVEPGAASDEIHLQAGATKVDATAVAQAAGATMTLEMLPAVNDFLVELENEGTLHCKTHANRIVRLQMDSVPRGPVDISIGAVRSTWTGDTSSGNVRACADRPFDGSESVALQLDGDRVECKGGRVEGVVSLDVTPATRKFSLKIGDVESSWTSSTASRGVHACIGSTGDIELGPLAAKSRIKLPSSIAFSQVLVRGDAEPAARAPVHCRPGDTLRTVALAGVDARQLTIMVGKVRVERISATLGATCDPAK